MDGIKKAGIFAGAIVGGTVGGTVSVVGKMTKIKWVDELGSSITQSAIFTGEVAGDVISGTTELLTGKLSRNEETAGRGWRDLTGCGKQVAGNFLTNAKYILKSGTELTGGLLERDPAKAADGVKNLAKFAAISAITVGTVRLPGAQEQTPGDSAPQEKTRE